MAPQSHCPCPSCKGVWECKSGVFRISGGRRALIYQMEDFPNIRRRVIWAAKRNDNSSLHDSILTSPAGRRCSYFTDKEPGRLSHLNVTQLRDDRVGCEWGLPDSKATKFCALSMRRNKIHIALGLGEQPLGSHWAASHSLFTYCLLNVYLVFCAMQRYRKCACLSGTQSVRRDKTCPQTTRLKLVCEKQCARVTDSLSNLKKSPQTTLGLCFLL